MIPKTDSLYFEVKSLLTNCFNKNFFHQACQTYNILSIKTMINILRKKVENKELNKYNYLINS